MHSQNVGVASNEKKENESLLKAIHVYYQQGSNKENFPALLIFGSVFHI